MAKKEITVKFKTITPLWTGDAWQENSEIRPSSLMGSLRFWFEVICYFSGICNKDDHFNPQLGRFEKEVNRKNFRDCLTNEGNSFEAKIKCLLEQDIPLPSIVFGTTNWKSLIRIKDIEYLDDYYFGNKLNLPDRICINKSDYEIKENEDCPRRSNEEWSVFYFAKPYFYGNFKVIFEVEEEIIESIFYPLLNFMEEYGFWGGKWNIGYGRLKVSKVKVNRDTISIDNNESFKFFKLINSELNREIISFSSFIHRQYINDLDSQFSKNYEENKDEKNEILRIVKISKNHKKLKVLEETNNNTNNNLTEIIKRLIKIKAQARANFKDSKELKHKIFGTTSPPPYDKNLLPQGSKILPYISKEKDNFKNGFISVVDLLTLEGENNG